MPYRIIILIIQPGNGIDLEDFNLIRNGKQGK